MCGNAPILEPSDHRSPMQRRASRGRGVSQVSLHAGLKRLPPDANGYAVPLSIDAFAGQILVEVISDGDAPPVWQGFLSGNAGATWRSTFSQRVCSQYGALFGNQHRPKFVEVWDDTAKYPPPHEQKLRFHTGTAS